MKMKFAKSCLVALAAGLFATNIAMAQSDDKAASLDELLNMVKESRINESAEHKKREQQFQREKNNQAGLLKQAQDTLAAEEARSARLEDTYAKQELDVDAKTKQFNEELGSLKELFGHLTSTAGDLRSTLSTSLISAQYPNRGEFLTTLIDKMNSNSRLPSIQEIERLWYEQQRQMVESGKIVKFNGTVIKPNGEQVSQEVVRVGSYNLLSNGKYLNYISDGYKMEELTRQPTGNYLSAADELQNAGGGLVGIGIDPTGPTGGSLLTALIDSPTWGERLWSQGGEVGYAIMIVGAVALLIGVWRFLYLFTVSAKVSSQLKSSKANTNNPLGRVLKVAEDNPTVDGETLELKLEEAVLKERPAIESGLSILKIIAAVAPLMGLLGTVTGMILTFQAITIFGAGDPKNMASGISSALITTVWGLLVAIPTVLIHTVVNGRAKRVLHVLEEQAAGIIAENAERK
ncbi:MotA/TolQ/ExbB proton channel family protein [Gilvimarinus agarilyticus]|uniref:MotA/TolQ/ExbB proton channel family protein n=1 Tax=unclassified Gilvimarinus TaxID=2642066 RepID=UPI001C087E4E|nr:MULTISPECIES: MotA/TolQ/ExbB proton channel family protein [unclassified Gilvimarinus]MBU2886591.1 MotA/TolQ/ExbB proton channel family protein [Gilvimarinus agarilyticus]MDO6571259.1 MotA/TolQ/ExbB proton channel family protein [Gilvimarinus sp. 2_MG-2023]MDO6746366.1 MotA/TolQ/ExbB proton channel family protein [Gilvimarinus sp. 1_MG-2023]